MEKLKFHKMWEAADTFVFDIDTGSILPILNTLPKVSSYGDKHFLYYYENGIGAAYYEEGEMKKASEAGLRDFSSVDYQKKYFSDIKELLEEQATFYQFLENTNLDKISNDNLKEILQKSIDLIVKNFGYYLACQPQCVSLIEKKIQEKLIEIVPENKIIEAFTLLSTPIYPTRMRIEEQEWINLLLKNIENKITEEERDSLIEKHYKKYFLLSAADGHEPWSLGYYKKKFDMEIKTSISVLQDKISLLNSSLDKIKSQKEKFIEKYKIPQEIINDCNLLAEIGHWRLEMRFVWMPGYYYDKYILNEVSKRFFSDKIEIRFATISEIFGLFDGHLIDESELIKRKKAFLFIIENGQTFILSGDDARNKMNEYVPKSDNSNIKTFKGNIAMKGKVTARALVYKWGDDMQQKLSTIKENFILIAGQTRPQLMPLIAKSSGIITDEGGITSHAAIVSRELGIPCIIGTKIATQVLKDGDLVEVDADNGIVNILK